MEVANELPIIFPFTTEFVVKIFLILFLAFYLVFAVLLVRQVHLMISSIQVPLSSLFNILAYLNLALAPLLLAAAIFVL